MAGAQNKTNAAPSPLSFSCSLPPLSRPPPRPGGRRWRRPGRRPGGGAVGMGEAGVRGRGCERRAPARSNWFWLSRSPLSISHLVRLQGGDGAGCGGTTTVTPTGRPGAARRGGGGAKQVAINVGRIHVILFWQAGACSAAARPGRTACARRRLGHGRHFLVVQLLLQGVAHACEVVGREREREPKKRDSALLFFNLL